MKYVKPTVWGTSFTCPHSGAFAMQEWKYRTWEFDAVPPGPQNRNNATLRVNRCAHCSQYCLWLNEVMVWPDRGEAPPPNPDMPDGVKKYYDEAASIAQKSPRGAAALLRLAIQVLCKELNEKGDNINADIASLVKKGLPVT